jgi:hypothetical protein
MPTGKSDSSTVILGDLIDITLEFIEYFNKNFEKENLK